MTYLCTEGRHYWWGIQGTDCQYVLYVLHGNPRREIYAFPYAADIENPLGQGFIRADILRGDPITIQTTEPWEELFARITQNPTTWFILHQL